MKYLSGYRLFEDDENVNANAFYETKNVINTINDICEDARDDMFEVKIRPNDDITIKMLSLYRKGTVDGPRTEITVEFIKEGFEIGDLKDVIDRLIKYIKGEQFYYHLEYVSESAKRAAGVSFRSPIPRRIEYDVLNDYLANPSDFTFSNSLDSQLRSIKLVFGAKYASLTEKFEIRKTKKIKKHLSKGGVSGVIRGLRGEENDFHTDLTRKEIDKALPTLEEVMNDLKHRYKKYKLGVDSIKYINSGAYGMAFIAGDKIIKLTSSKSEAKIAKGLIGMNMKRCVCYYDVVYIKSYDIYAILMDRADKLTKDERMVIDEICDYEVSMGDAKEVSKNMNVSKSFARDMIKEFTELEEILKSQRIPTQDLHSGNIGRINGKLVHFDIMGDSSVSVSKIKKLSSR